MTPVQLIAGALAVSAVWLLHSVLFIASGSFVRRLLPGRIQPADGLLHDWWIGWTVSVTLLFVWYLVFPIGALAYLPLVALALAGAVAGRRHWGAAAQSARNTDWALVILLAAGTLAAAVQTFGPVYQYDAGLYHLPAIQWAETYPLAPGLGNLHGRLGTNSSALLFSALMEGWRELTGGAPLASGLVLLPLLARSLTSVHGILRNKSEWSASSLFDALLLPVLLYQIRRYAPGFSPDGAVFAVTMVVAGELLRMLEATRTTRQADGRRVAFILMLAAAGLTVKLSFVAFGVVSVIIAFVVWLRRSGASSSRSRWAVVSAAAAGAGLIALWVLHGILLSGYPAYPATLAGMAVDWRVPSEIVSLDAQWIRSWGRRPGVRPDQVLGSMEWLPGWMRATLADSDVRGVLLALAVVVLPALALSRKIGAAAPQPRRIWLFFLPALAGIAYWFVTAPQIRFAFGVLWTVVVGLAAIILARFRPPVLPAKGMRGGWLALGAGLVVYVASGLIRASPGIPEIGVTSFSTRSGLRLNVPIHGDQCWDAPLPCTPYPDSALELRHPPSLRMGFRHGAASPSRR